MNSRAKIMVVDDDVIVCSATRRALESVGYEVLIANDGEEAIQRARAYKPDLVLMDVNMPKLDGIEALRQMKGDPDIASVYVILISGSRMDSDSQVKGLDTGADGYLVRPVSNREVVARVQSMLRIKSAEDALRQKEQQLRNLIAHNVDGMLVVSREGQALFANPAACKMLDREQETIEGQDIGIPITAGEHTDLDLLRPNGSRHTVEMRVVEIEWQGQSAFLVALHDITERKRKEEQLRALTQDLERSNKDLEQFAYIAAHDLQEPLRMVSNFVSLLAKRYQGQLDADADGFIQYALDGTARMQALIDDWLVYSRVGSHRKPLARTDCAVALRQALSNLQSTIEEQQATVTYDELPTVMADEAQLVQLFQNLIGNAIKFHGAEPPRVHIRARQSFESAEPWAVWEFSVRDNGIGIPQKDYARIFTIFQRLHTQAEYPGTGIGLSVCQRIVEQHSGRIWVESEVGKGTTFYFTLKRQ